MKILIIQKKMIGDVLTTSVLFEALKKEMPQAELHYIVMKHTVPVIANNPFIDKVICSDNDTEQSLSKQLKSTSYDIVIDVYSKMASGWLTRQIGAPLRIGLNKWFAAFVYTHRYNLRPKSKEGIALALENRFQLLQPILESIPYHLKPKIYITDDERETVKKRLETFDVEFHKPLYMINVLGSSIDKTYPPEDMAVLIDAIVNDQPKAQILFNYIPNQLEQATAIFDFCNYDTQQRIRLDLYGESLREFIIITSFCTALIGNEGGAVNMAKAVNIPTFAIFSPWVTTASWAINSKEDKNVAVHLKDFYPQLFSNYKKKVFKKNQAELYKRFTPDLIKPKLKHFLHTIA